MSVSGKMEAMGSVKPPLSVSDFATDSTVGGRNIEASPDFRSSLRREALTMADRLCRRRYGNESYCPWDYSRHNEERPMRRAILTYIMISLFAAVSCAEESIPFVDVPGGTFTRGAEGGTGYPNYNEVRFGADNPLDEVTVSSFRMSKHEIPFGLYREFAEKHWEEYGLTELS